MTRNLSKSKYISGLKCEKRLWLEVNDPDKATPMTEAQERIVEQGTEVGKRARKKYPGGIPISLERFNINNAITETEKAISTGAPIIFEAAFLYDDTYAITDVIESKEDGSWDIIEVKSALSIHDEYIPDLAVQKYVLEGSGLKINKTQLMLLNEKCVYPDLSNLFVIEDVTNKVNEIFQQIPSGLQNFKSVILEQSEPNIVIGPHCTNRYDCPFIGHCWKKFDNMTVFHIPYLGIRKKLDLREKGILTIDKIPPDYPLPPKQREYVDIRLNEKINIDKPGIQKELSQLAYPLYFLDFETFNPAIPRFDGMSPYNKFPFQYSCHVMQENGSLDHFEYLQLDEKDPRKPLVESLLACIDKSGSVVAYSAGFEKGVLNKLAGDFPDYSDGLKSIAERLWDQAKIFNYHYKDFRFGSTFSLKSVLPVLLPELAYDSLAIQGGTEAGVVWEQMINAEDGAEKEKMIEDLKEYCKRDTIAMVEIHKHLLEKLK